jgi:hypothetical protein
MKTSTHVAVGQDEIHSALLRASFKKLFEPKKSVQLINTDL